MEILKAAQGHVEEITGPGSCRSGSRPWSRSTSGPISDFLAKDRLQGHVLRQGDYMFIGTR